MNACTKDSLKTTPVKFAHHVYLKYKPINHLEKLSSFNDTIIEPFDKDGNVKPWKANELAFYDTILRDILKSRVPLKPPSQRSLPVPACPLSTNSGRYACPKNLWERVKEFSLRQDSDFRKRLPPF